MRLRVHWPSPSWATVAQGASWTQREELQLWRTCSCEAAANASPPAAPTQILGPTWRRAPREQLPVLGNVGSPASAPAAARSGGGAMRSILAAPAFSAFVAAADARPRRVARLRQIPGSAVLGPEQPAAATEQLIAASPPAASAGRCIAAAAAVAAATGPPHRSGARRAARCAACRSSSGGDCRCSPRARVCEKPAVPKCASQWGLELPIAPCQALALESEDWRDFPATCECLFDCHRLNQRLAYVSNCVNASGTPILPLNHESIRNDPAEQRRRRVAHAAGSPFVDGWGDGRWVRQAYTPGAKGARSSRSMRRRSSAEAQPGSRGASEARRRKSVREGLCSGRGIMTGRCRQNGAQARWVARGDAAPSTCASGMVRRQLRPGRRLQP